MSIEKAENIVLQEFFSAAKYYMGVPDEKYLEATHIEENAVNAKKAYCNKEAVRYENYIIIKY